MKKKVLIVDDDKVLLSILKKKFAGYADTFDVMTAMDGVSAIQLLKTTTISIVVADIRMPRMDGFGLLSYVAENYPDIRVIIMTAHDMPKTQNIVLKGGAVAYVKKPFQIEDLSRKIVAYLEKEAEGGLLNNASLETFIQLVEMEAKTCTIRVFNAESNKYGVLFFMEGDILDARYRDCNGTKAAYEIFSWSHISLSIENHCPLKAKRIDGDLQAILLEAMRLKDELAEREAGMKIAIERVPLEETVPEEQNATVDAAEPQTADDESEGLLLRVAQALIGRSGVIDIFHDASWDPLVSNVTSLGARFGAKNLMACYVCKGEEQDYILVPDETTVVTSVSPRCARDNLIKAITDAV
ncbi:MAG: hypothetical protein CSA22_01565 [Deltaproteobacteria bacterium]|nr:MAG: hypothetical protein CSA22_01565 [Deltaproteobacteria bacterium]